jgi:hypothetical protein
LEDGAGADEFESSLLLMEGFDDFIRNTITP